MVIYKATNKLVKKCYIGQAIDFKKRQSCHFSLAIGDNPSSYFHRALKKYGKDNFEWKILCECETKEELDEMEFHHIKQYNSFGSGGYNLTLGGEGKHGCGLFGKDNPNYGKKCSDETKKKISDANKGNVAWNKGKKRPEFSKEWREAISKGNIGKSMPKGKDCKLSKKYIIIYPDGNKKTITGLRDFCRKNNLTYQGLISVMSKKQTHHKGFKCERIYNEI